MSYLKLDFQVKDNFIWFECRLRRQDFCKNIYVMRFFKKFENFRIIFTVNEIIRKNY